MELRIFLLSVLLHVTQVSLSQNLITDAGMNAASNWNNQEMNPETTYLAGAACGSNSTMEVDVASFPQQTVSGFISGAQYVLTFRYAWRTQSCSASGTPTSLLAQFTDATSVLNYTLAVPNTVTSLTTVSTTFTNNTSTSHTLKFTNPGNTNTCGVIIDDISITMLASPGGVGTSFLSAWFRAGTISITDGSGVYGWISNGNNTIILKPSCSNPPIYKTGVASVANSLVANFNPYITFNGTNQYMANTVNRFDLVNLSVGLGGSIFAVHEGGTGSSTYYAQKSSTSAWGGVWMNTAGVQMAGSSGTSRNAAYTASARNNILAFNGIATVMNLKDKNGATLSDNSGTADMDYLTIGARQAAAGTVDQYFNGSMSEAIEFNTILSDLQMQQVRSYLAAKYGVTLLDNSQTLFVDEDTYVASDGLTLYWTYLFNFLYHNNVTIIGRDDNTGLDQRKSISTDADVNGVVTGNNAMLTIDNAGAFTSDKSFFATGHNGISNLGTMETSDVPTGIQSRMKRFWKFQKTGLGVASSITAKFDMTGFTPLTGSDLRLLVSTLPSFNSLTTSIIIGSYSAPYFTVSLPTTGGVYFTLGSVNKTTTPLPIELLQFSATPCNNEVCLDWSTATEINNNYFTIDKTKDGSTFEVVGNINGAGNSTSNLNYSYTDQAPYEGISYYRLKQTDYNGVYTYSDLKMVNFKTIHSLSFNVFPNPGDGENINFKFKESNNQQVSVTLSDAIGKKIAIQTFITDDNGDTIYTIALTNKLSAGIYMITGSTDQNVYRDKLIIK